MIFGMRCVALGLMVVCLGLAGCGAGSPAACVTSFSLGVGPTSATADHMAAAPGNQVTLQAYSGETLVSGTGCVIPEFIANVNAAWTSTDPVDVQLSSVANGTGEVATCVGTTSEPVTLTASLTSQGVTKTATSQLTCK